MRKSNFFLLLAAAGVCAVSAQSVTVQRGQFPQVERSTHNLLLRAMEPRVTAIEPGKMRVLIPVDGVVYEVIVVFPGEPRLVPVSAPDAAK